MTEISTRREGFTKRVRRLMDHYELAERLATITGRVDEAALRRAQPMGADIIAAYDAQAARIAELEAQQSRYDALEDAVDQAQAWALDVHLGNRDALQGKAAEIYALCYNARNDKEAADELETS